MKMCILCKKIFQEIHKHHISYTYDCTIDVCSRCHMKIHNSPCYPMFKPLDLRLGEHEYTGDYYICKDCDHIKIYKNFKFPFKPFFCCRCRSEHIEWLQKGDIEEKPTESIMPQDIHIPIK